MRVRVVVVGVPWVWLWEGVLVSRAQGVRLVVREAGAVPHVAVAPGQVPEGHFLHGPAEARAVTFVAGGHPPSSLSAPLPPGVLTTPMSGPCPRVRQVWEVAPDLTLPTDTTAPSPDTPFRKVTSLTLIHVRPEAGVKGATYIAFVPSELRFGSDAVILGGK